jgi:hypothetical protein
MSTPLSSTNVLANVTSTLFQGGPKDIVATPDIYNLNSGQINSGQTVNTTVGRFNPQNSSSVIGNLVAGAIGALAGLTGLSAGSVTSLVTTAASLTNPDTLSRLSSSLGVNVGSTSSDFQVSLNSAINLNSNSFTSLAVTVGGVTVGISTSDVTGTLGILNTVNNLAGTSIATSLDIGAQVTTVSALTSSLLGLGLNDAVSGLITSQTATTGTGQTVGAAALAQNVQQAIQSSNLTTVQLCITTLGVGGVLSAVPTAALELVQYFAIPAGTVSSGYAALWTQLLGILVQLNPNWEYSTYNNVQYPNLLYFTTASADCRTVMATSEDPIVIAGAAIGSSYTQEASLTTLQAMYPFMLNISATALTAKPLAQAA